MPRKKKRPRTEDGGGVPSGGAGGPEPPNADIDGSNLRFNSAFAERYDAQKRRELLASMPDAALGEEEESSSDDEEEDELGELLTKKLDRRIHETLLALQSKDPRIYDKDELFFEDKKEANGAENEIHGESKSNALDRKDGRSGSDSDDSDDGADDSDDEPVAGWDAIVEKAEETNAGKVTLKDYVRENLLHDGRLSDSDSEHEDGSRAGAVGARKRRVSFGDEKGGPLVREGRPVKDCAMADEGDKKSGDNSDDDDDESREEADGGGYGDADDDFFTKKEKTEEEAAQEDAEFEDFLVKQSKKKGSSSKPGDELLLHSYLEKETPDEKERFLRDFILNNGWLARGNGAAPGASDYKIEIDDTKVHDDSGEDGVDSEDGGEGAGPDGDSDFEDQVDAFEHSYNFRFEEPDGAKVVSHARTVEGSLRRPDDRRKQAREARKKRKEHEKLVKTEEIKHLKNLKKREIEARLTALQDAAGDGVDFSGIDLDADFDPDEFSKQMESRFGDEYYEQGEDDAKVLKKQLKTSRHLQQSAGDRADDVDGEGEGHGGSVEHDVGLNDDVKRLVDEYYNLNYEDIIGGTPVRFKYKKVDKESFNMDPEDILATDDKELNRQVSLKYLAPYRSKGSIPSRAWKNKSASDSSKRSRSDSRGDRGDRGDKEKSRYGEKKRGKKRERGESVPQEWDENAVRRNGAKEGKSKKKSIKSDKDDGSVDQADKGEKGKEGKKQRRKKNKSRKEKEADAVSSLPASRRAAYGL